ncbi:DegV family protein [Metabacillus litoralis]|uniref:DegV family protein n=1 Tax=Metabacillus litoralis TaxID=152268 RepID=UPI00203B4244|nr:DegV family protein [Metabacillus litoralis]MCM3410126.1 DegV family protein [Metabacillus litoralis]
MKTAIVTDSTAYIPQHIRESHDIHMIPLSVNFGNETYQEEIEITSQQFFEKMRDQQELPTTSQPSIGMFVELFARLSKEYDAVISIHLSSGISGTYNGAATSGDMVENIEVYPFDTEVSAMVQGFYALEAAEMAQAGKSPTDIMARLEEMKKTMSAYIMVDDLTNLQKGGRLSGAAALIGSLLQVKPILHFDNKVIVPYEKVRTKKKALNRVFDLLHEDAKDNEPMRVVVIHANRPEEAEKMKEELQEKYKNIECMVSYFGPVVGTHLGEGAIGIGWYKK